MPTVTTAVHSDLNILVVVDTYAVFDAYMKKPRDKAGRNPLNAVGIDHTHQFMICNAGHVNKGEATADLSFNARVGDTVHFWGTSLSFNSKHSVVVYDVRPFKGSGVVFGKFAPVQRTVAKAAKLNCCAAPDPSNLIQLVNESFCSFAATLLAAGTENYYLYFALYALNETTQEQELVDYFCWDPQITVTI